MQGNVQIRRNEDLDHAIAGAKYRSVGDGANAWGRKNSGCNISPLVAATAGLWAFEQKKKSRMVNLFCDTCGGVVGDCGHEPVGD